jgi:hypothetical protein
LDLPGRRNLPTHVLPMYLRSHATCHMSPKVTEGFHVVVKLLSLIMDDLGSNQDLGYSSRDFLLRFLKTDDRRVPR